MNTKSPKNPYEMVWVGYYMHPEIGLLTSRFIILSERVMNPDKLLEFPGVCRAEYTEEKQRYEIHIVAAASRAIQQDCLDMIWYYSVSLEYTIRFNPVFWWALAWLAALILLSWSMIRLGGF